jgi:hypothetical protein
MDLGHFRAGFKLEEALFILRCADYIVGRGPLSSSERATNDVAAETRGDCGISAIPLHFLHIQ